MATTTIEADGETPLMYDDQTNEMRALTATGSSVRMNQSAFWRMLKATRLKLIADGKSFTIKQQLENTDDGNKKAEGD